MLSSHSPVFTPSLKDALLNPSGQQRPTPLLNGETYYIDLDSDSDLSTPELSSSASSISSRSSPSDTPFRHLSPESPFSSAPTTPEQTGRATSSTVGLGLWFAGPPEEERSTFATWNEALDSPVDPVFRTSLRLEQGVETGWSPKHARAGGRDFAFSPSSPCHLGPASAHSPASAAHLPRAPLGRRDDLPAAQSFSSTPFPFRTSPSYVAPGPPTSHSRPHVPVIPTAPASFTGFGLSLTRLKQIASLHGGRAPTSAQLAPPETALATMIAAPVVDTGNQGVMVAQPGDWRCGECDFLNWRRRKVCMRCFPNSHPSFAKSLARAQEAAAHRSLPPCIAPTAPRLEPAFLTPRPAPTPPTWPSHPLCPLPLVEGNIWAQSHDELASLERYFSTPARGTTDNAKARRRVGGVVGVVGMAY
ncbi:hypothetical protein JCM10207_002085 [Rhodosporidiobolus poonsookiae]